LAPRIQAAIVARIHKDGVVGYAASLEELSQPAQVGIDVSDHSVEAWLLQSGNTDIRSCIGVKRPDRVVCGRRREVAEEWLMAALGKRHKVHSAIEENICAEARIFFERAIVQISVVAIVVVEVVGSLRNAPSAAHNGFIEMKVHRPARVIVAEMPLSENAGCISRRLEALRHRHV
jgi:hypothetical protein